MTRPSSYREDNGCWNCQHASAAHATGMSGKVLCLQNAGPIPDEFEYVHWVEDNLVGIHGTCGEWKHRTEDGE